MVGFSTDDLFRKVLGMDVKGWQNYLRTAAQTWDGDRARAAAWVLCDAQDFVALGHQELARQQINIAKGILLSTDEEWLGSDA